MIRFQDSSQLNSYIKQHESDFQPIQSGKIISKQNYQLIGFVSEKHGTFWKISRILKMVLLFPLSVCSSKIKRKFSKTITEFKTGESRIKIYALDKIYKGQNLDQSPQNTENFNEKNKIDPTHEETQNPKKDIEVATPVEKNINGEKKNDDSHSLVNSSLTTEEFEQLLNRSTQDVKLLGELIGRVCKTNNLDQLVQIFSKLEVKQVQDYFNSLKDSYNQSNKEFTEVENELKYSTTADTSEWTGSTGMKMYALFGPTKQVTHEKFNELTLSRDVKKTEYEQLKNQTELVYINLILYCQKLDEAKSNEIMNCLLETLRQFNEIDLMGKIIPVLNASQASYILSSNHKEFVDSAVIESLIGCISSNGVILKNFVATLNMTFFSRWFEEATKKNEHSMVGYNKLLEPFFVEMHQQKKLIPFIQAGLFRYGNPMAFLLMKPLSKEELISVKYKFVFLSDNDIEFLYRQKADIT